MTYHNWFKPARYMLVALFTFLTCVMLTACGQTTASAPQYEGAPVKWKAESAHQHVYLTLTLGAGERLREVTLYGDKELEVLDIPDTCIDVLCHKDNVHTTWFAFPNKDKVVVFSPASAEYMTEGTYSLEIRFRMRRHVTDPAQDRDMTPTVLEVRATETIER